MLSKCPHCQQELRFNEAQRQKLLQALEKLGPGKQLNMKCPHCQSVITMDGVAKGGAVDGSLQPPAPPDLDWLKSGRYDGEERVEDVPMALVLYADSPQREHVIETMKSVGYQVVTADSAEEAIERMQFVSFSCIVFQSEFEGALSDSTFHTYMRTMAMERRRYIFYILIGPGFHSLYDLEALAYSANLVVGENDLKYYDVILRKAIPAYEELFGGILEELANYGKR